MSLKILHIDDSKMVRLLIGRAFKKFGCEIFEAGNGLDGINLAKTVKPDIILLDVTMPVMDGVETMTEIKNSEELKGIPVIMLTAEGSPEMILTLAKLGVRDHITKPFKEQDIIDRVARVLPLPSLPEAGVSTT